MVKRIIIMVWTGLVMSISIQAQGDRGLQPGPGPTPVPGKRIALVIGNAKYQHGTPLKNPVNDAELMEQTLRELNFEVITRKNANLEEMEQVLRVFTDKIEKENYELALCYYSGHGLEVNGENFLMPVEANPTRQSEVKYKCLNAQRILDGMEEARAVTKIMVLDACRDNPLPKGWERSSGGGLVVLPAPEGSLVAYATASKTTAWDGDGKNSPYTAALARYLKEPGLEIAQVLNRTAAATRDAAKQVGRVQTPISSNSLTGDLFLVPVQGPREPVVPAPNSVVPSVEDHGPMVGKMILVKGGTFSMGCGQTVADCYDDERPVFSVTLNDYYLGQYEVTQEQWQRVMGRNPSTTKNCPSCPVESVSWEEVQEYIAWLNKFSGKNYRLPTEAEWEFAAREGGKDVLFGNGKGVANPMEINCDPTGQEVVPYALKGVKRGAPVSVGSLNAPNALGIHDLSGNVAEWCSDWYGKYSASSKVNPTGPANKKIRVIRGGSWNSKPRACRTTNRYNAEPTVKSSTIGFRLAMSL